MSCLPADVTRLLWDVDPGALDLEREGDRDLVFERVMSRGNLAAMRWLRAHFTTGDLAAFVRGKGRVKLGPRDRAYWGLVTGVEVTQAPGGGRPGWADP